MIKFFDLNASIEELRLELDQGYQRVLASGWTILGPELEAFESEFAQFCGVKHCVGVANGLDALALVLKARGLGPGDEVIVPSHTFVATWLAVAAVGAKPVPVEVDARSFTIDPSAIEAAVTSRTAAIIPVSLYGHPAEMDYIMGLADRRGLFVVEDAAQAHGSRHRGRRTGSLAHATAFSFYPTKNLGALGDAGGIVTDDAELAGRLRVLRNYGSREKYIHREIGGNSRLDELQAAFLRAKLGKLDKWNDNRRTLANLYSGQLEGVETLTVPTVAHWAEHVYHLYVVRSEDRGRLSDALKQYGIATLVHYPVACHLQEAIADLGFKRGAFPIAERSADEVLSLPMWPQMDQGVPEQVSNAISRIVASRKMGER